MNSTEPEGPPPRLCHLIKWADFDGYGFNLHAEKSKPGQFIGKVDEDSPASLAGLLEGDKIIEVNSVNISNENHRQVVERIKSMPNETRLLVVDPAAERWYRENKVIPRSTQGNVIYEKTPPTKPGSKMTKSEPKHEVLESSRAKSDSPTGRPGSTECNGGSTPQDSNGGDHHHQQNGANGPSSLSSTSTDGIDEGLQRVSLDPQASPPVQIHHHNGQHATHNGERVHVVDLERTNSSNSTHRNSLEMVPHDSPRSSKSNLSSSGRGSTEMSSRNQNGLKERISTSPKPSTPIPSNGTPNGHSNHSNQNGLTRSDSTNTGSDSGSTGGKSSNHSSSIDAATLRTMQVEDILNLNLTASQVRELIASRKRRDPKKEPLDLRQKYDIIQQL